jgi:hypothetical protein
MQRPEEVGAVAGCGALHGSEQARGSVFLATVDEQPRPFQLGLGKPSGARAFSWIATAAAKTDPGVRSN